MADEELVREITRLVHQEVGSADPQLLAAVVSEVMKAVAVRTSRPVAGPAVRPEPVGRPGNLRLPVVGKPAADLSLSDCVRCRASDVETRRGRGVVTVTGKNRPGIVAKVAGTIAECHADILDISQTLVGGFFTMILVIDLKELPAHQLSFKDLKEKLAAAGRALGVEVVTMHEEIFSGMQRI